MIYLDYNATTPLAPEALAAMRPFLEEHHGNPSSIHAAGRTARAAVDDARDRLAALLGAKPHEIIFTGGGTESDNLAILGLARSLQPKGNHLITCATEHHAVLEAFAFLQKVEGFAVTVLGVDRHGVLDLEELRRAWRKETTLVSVMSANNETGTLQPITEIAALCREHGALFHSDMIQSFGKQPVRADDADAISLAGHKFHGPKGAGVLVLRSGTPISSIQYGGAHENQRRPGTENVAAIAGMAAAAEAAVRGMNGDGGLREQLAQGIRSIFPAAVENGHPTERLANTLNMTFPGLDGESLLINLDLEGICVSSGSACMVGSIVPSHVLIAMGVPADQAGSTVRFSLGKQTTVSDIEGALAALRRIVARLTDQG